MPNNNTTTTTTLIEDTPIINIFCKVYYNHVYINYEDHDIELQSKTGYKFCKIVEVEDYCMNDKTDYCLFLEDSLIKKDFYKKIILGIEDVNSYLIDDDDPNGKIIFNELILQQ